MHPAGNESIDTGSIFDRSVELPVWKRAIDIAFSLAAMPVLALCTLMMAIVMKITSPGPVFFRQERVGLRGRRFKIFKFRTMVVDADTKTHKAHWDKLIHSSVPMVKLDTRDSRLIPGGWLLRASGVDELPQLINVLRGDMSIIGPRPCIPYEYEQYLPWQRERFEATPGLTGLWQVSGKNRTTFEEMIHLDIHYVRNRSFWLDVKIVLRTAPALLLQVRDTRQHRQWSALPRKTAAPFPRKLSSTEISYQQREPAVDN